ncbi:4-hydroxyphenylacetate 3-hydroxylase family protein [Methylobacterium soli]|uniref:4-hydroxyphenylacetate 3-monooxygenase n=1 Tax=Methylobacterium soli TaxID=553447 RepID=A0A6L3SUH1_9HYPH|nr:4-hydroxyphenylacetate 3-hydroxylase N-terminal domain-containing protein [Methylobacterium soli]KAB1076467.1 4-hydroxyphenylacetate 3-monooxygenase [Methylobacterium soli]GJE44671.1 Anthranilate 3-monooxygenase oxygenase component [Methylobacterium soli]
MPKSGEDHIRSVNDGRCVYINGDRVTNIAEHSAFQNAVRSVARLYDFQADPANLDRMTFETPTGQRASRAWQLPKSYRELVERREALVSWAQLHQGFMGRSPDHVASTLAAMSMGLDVFERHTGGRPLAVRDYYAYARDNDLYVSYVIIDPQGDRSKGTSADGNADLAVSICDEDAEGITVRGSKMLGTGAVLSNEVLVTTLRPLGPTEEKYAFTAAVPINAKGLKLLSRRSYEQAAPSVFDNPLASQFDENDAVLYFDEVKIPWERVFVHRDPACQLAQWHNTPAHSYQNYQAEIRLLVKMRFLVGLARKITETIGTINYPSVRETLGELASQVGMIEAFVYGMEAKGWQYGEYYLPDPNLVYAAQVQSQTLYPKVIHTLRELSGGGVLMLPSSLADFHDPEIANVIRKTQVSPVLSSEERVQLFKLAWDAIGSEFASRHTQYEMFYSGPRTVTTGMAFRCFDWKQTADAVNGALSPDALPASLLAGQPARLALVG